MVSSSEAAEVRTFPGQARPAARDRVPPQNLDAEASVLGSMLLSKNAIADVSEILRPEDFYRGAHRTIFEAIRNLYDRGEPVDAVTLTDELDGRGLLDDVGGPPAIAEFVSRVPTAANAVYYGKIVADHALRRRLIDAGGEITRIGFEEAEDAPAAVDKAESLMYDVGQRGIRSEFTPMRDLLQASFEQIERLHENNSAITGLATGFTDFDELTAGLQPSNLVIIAARPAMGKCLRKTEYVLDPRTGALDQIGDLVDSRRAATVACLDPAYRLRPTVVSAHHHNGVQQVFELRTRLGRKVGATANHPFLTVDGWKPLGDLQPGERIATPRALPYFGADALPDAEVAMLGYLLGDGGLGDATPRVTTTSPVLLEDVKRCAGELGVNVVPVPGTPSHCLPTPMGQAHPLTRRLCEHGLMGARSATKSVPEAVFRTPKEQVALFLNRLFAADGSVFVNEAYAQVAYTSISETLVRQVQHLLLRFGVIAKLRELHRPGYEGTGNTAWELQITDPEGVRTFSREIGILGEDDRLARAVQLFDSRPGSSANRDLVPAEVWERVLDAKGSRSWRALSLATGRPASHSWHAGKRSPSRRLLAEIAGDYGDADPTALVTSDVYWDEVVSIEPAGEEPVYDLTVPGDHNFVASDIIVHNSTLVTNIATHVAVELRQPVVMFSLEMSQMELVHRVLAAEGKVDSERLRTGRLQESDWPKLSQAMGKLAEANLFIDDTPGINLMEIRSKCRRLKQKHGLSLVIVDYLQLMQSHTRAENRVQEVSQLSRGLKILAKELDLPVVALSQLSRRPEDRTDRRPHLSDLRESGSLEQDADLVAFIYRDEVYNPDSDAKGEAELIVSKHRNGPLKTVRLSFLGHHSRFASMARGPMGGGGAPL